MSTNEIGGHHPHVPIPGKQGGMAGRSRRDRLAGCLARACQGLRRQRRSWTFAVGQINFGRQIDCWPRRDHVRSASRRSVPPPEGRARSTLSCVAQAGPTPRRTGVLDRPSAALAKHLNHLADLREGNRTAVAVDGHPAEGARGVVNLRGTPGQRAAVLGQEPGGAAQAHRPPTAAVVPPG